MTFQLVGLVWFMVFNATYKLNSSIGKGICLSVDIHDKLCFYLLFHFLYCSVQDKKFLVFYLLLVCLLFHNF